MGSEQESSGAASPGKSEGSHSWPELVELEVWNHAQRPAASACQHSACAHFGPCED